jgi:hypothetical protein
MAEVSEAFFSVSSVSLGGPSIKAKCGLDEDIPGSCGG